MEADLEELFERSCGGRPVVRGPFHAPSMARSELELFERASDWNPDTHPLQSDRFKRRAAAGLLALHRHIPGALQLLLVRALHKHFGRRCFLSCALVRREDFGKGGKAAGRRIGIKGTPGWSSKNMFSVRYAALVECRQLELGSTLGELMELLLSPEVAARLTAGRNSPGKGGEPPGCTRVVGYRGPPWEVVHTDANGFSWPVHGMGEGHLSHTYRGLGNTYRGLGKGRPHGPARGLGKGRPRGCQRLVDLSGEPGAHNWLDLFCPSLPGSRGAGVHYVHRQTTNEHVNEPNTSTYKSSERTGQPGLEMLELAAAVSPDTTLDELGIGGLGVFFFECDRDP